MCEAVGLLEEGHRLVGAGESLGEACGLFVGERVRLGGDRRLEPAQRHRLGSGQRSDEGAGGGEILEFAELVELAQLGRDAVVPDRGAEVASHGEQKLGLVVLVVVEQHVRHQDGVVGGDDRREAGGLAGGVKPFGHGAASSSHRLMSDDVPGSLAGDSRGADQRIADGADRSEASLGVGEQVLARADAGRGQQARRERIEGQETAVVLEITFDRARGLVGEFGIVGQDEQLGLGERRRGEFGLGHGGMAQTAGGELAG